MTQHYLEKTDYIPEFIEIEFEEWWFEVYPAIPRDMAEWGEQFRQIYTNAKNAWVVAFQRGLEVNY